MSVVAARLVVVALAAFAVPATAHVGALETRAPYFSEGGFVGAGTTWGITLSEDEGVLRTCDEATDGITQWTLNTSAHILVGTTTGLYRTETGCALQRIAFADETPFLVAQADDRDVLAIVTTTGETTRLYTSDDGGLSLTLAMERTDFTALSVQISRDGTEVVIAGFNALVVPEVVFADALGAQVVPLIWDTDAPVFINVVGTDDQAAEERFALSLISAEQTSRLALVDLRAVLDGAAQQTALTIVAAFDEVVTHYASTAAGRAVLLNRRTFLSQLGETTFKAEPAGPTRCLHRHPETDAMLGCGTDESGDAVGSSVDGRIWTWEFPFEAIEDRLCPAGTIGRFRCAYLFPDIDAGPAPVIDAGVVDGGGATVDGGDGGNEDAGEPVRDAGAPLDAGAPGVDAGEGTDAGLVDGGSSVPPTGPCGCSTAQTEPPLGLALGLLVTLGYGWRRRRGAGQKTGMSWRV